MVTSAITDKNGNQHKPLYLHKPAGAHTHNMYRSYLVQEEVNPSPDAAEVLAPLETETRVEAHSNVPHGVDEDYETPEMAKAIADYHANYYQDSDREVQKRGDDSHL